LKTELLAPAGRLALELKVLWGHKCGICRGARALWRKPNRCRAVDTRLEKTTFELNFQWNYSFCNLGNALRILHWREPAAFC